MPDFPDALVALGPTRPRRTRAANATTATLRRPRSSSRKADRGTSAGFLEIANARLYPFWADLTEALRSGRPQNEIKQTGKSMFEELYSDPDRLEQFMQAMAGVSAGPHGARREIRTFPDTGPLCDAEAPPVSCRSSWRAPSPSCVHQLRPAGRSSRSPSGPSKPPDSADRVTTAAGDFFAEPAAQGGRRHDGHGPPRLEPRAETATR